MSEVKREDLFDAEKPRKGSFHPIDRAVSYAFTEITMTETATTYVERTSEGSWRVSGSRVSLDSVIHAYWEGLSPEQITTEFPTLSLEQVHGAIAFYLHNRGEMDRYLTAQEGRWEELRRESEIKHGPLLERLRQARKPAQ